VFNLAVASKLKGGYVKIIFNSTLVPLYYLIEENENDK
jgi:hypothetical protein